MRLRDLLVREKVFQKRFMQVPLIVGDDSLAYIDSLPDSACRWTADDFPGCIPPFASQFVEARSFVADIHYAAVVLRTEVSGDAYIQNLVNEIRKLYPSLLINPKWVVTLVGFWREKKLLLCYDRAAMFLLSENGAILNPHIGPIMTVEPDKTATLLDKRLQFMTEEMFFELFPFIFRTFSMLNCVNVEMVECSPPEKVAKRYLKKYKVPMSSWYEYRVKSKKYAAAEQAGERDEGGQRTHYRQHFCRGHFKRRKTGIYWWNDQIRGHAELGTIRKSYNVEDENG